MTRIMLNHVRLLTKEEAQRGYDYFTVKRKKYARKKSRHYYKNIPTAYYIPSYNYVFAKGEK